MNVSIMALIGLPLLLVLISVWCYGTIRLWRRVLRPPSDGLSRCGHCGYAVEGLEKMACPECGSDFRKVGIVTAERQQPVMSTTSFGFAWAALTFPCVFVVAILLRIFGIGGFDAPIGFALFTLSWFIPYVLGMMVFLNRRRR